MGIRGNLLEVKADCTHDELVGRESLVDDVGIVDDVTTEDEAATAGENDIHSAAERNENSHKASHALTLDEIRHMYKKGRGWAYRER